MGHPYTVLLRVLYLTGGASLIQLVCADILLLPSSIHCGFDVHKSPCPTANFRLVLCRSGRACNLRASRLPSLLEQESAIRVQATAPSITSNSCVRSGPVTEYTAPNRSFRIRCSVRLLFINETGFRHTIVRSITQLLNIFPVCAHVLICLATPRFFPLRAVAM